MKSEIDGYLFDILDALRSPVVYPSPHWADTMPERILKLIPMARLVNVRTEQEYATDPEVVLYLSASSFEAPLGSDWTDIFVHIACKVEEQYFKRDLWDELQASKKLSEYQENQLLMPLRKKIYAKRRKALKEMLKEKPEKFIPIESEKEILVAAGVQLSLF